MESDIKQMKKDIADIKSLLILFLQSIDVDNKSIGNALGATGARVSQLVRRKAKK